MLVARNTTMNEKMNTPTRRGGFDCCAVATAGHAAAPPSNVMNSRRLMGLTPKAKDR